jgi:hypothetical protein
MLSLLTDEDGATGVREGDWWKDDPAALASAV